ncbi:MAG: hypothetical protein AAGF30_11020 [Pseudomonadota bacterium]
MTALHLEDFGAPSGQRTVPRGMAAESALPDAYDDAYNAGWDDALAQIEEERGRIGEKLADRLAEIGLTREEALSQALRALEPLLHDIFDKVLPNAAERGFLPMLLQEAEAVLQDAKTGLVLMVAPEEVPALESLLASRADLQAAVSVRAEPALSLSQALLSWDGGQRRLDLQGIMTALDSAFEAFLDRPSGATTTSKEAS